MLTYKVKKVANYDEFKRIAPELERAYVTNYPWGCEYRPETFGTLAWDGENIFVYMRTYDKYRKADASDNGDIYMDSCMEFFVNPIPGVRDIFINFEVNPRGNLYLAIGPKEIENRVLLDTTEYNHFGIERREKAQDGEYWDFSAKIPLEFFEKNVPEFKRGEELHLTGNFFKCGDGLPEIHYGTWSNIEPKTPQPFFYRIDCFAALDFMNK